jgi:catechol 2,3-dioxygenase-like lactoylglutathione lyase family enzyme
MKHVHDLKVLFIAGFGPIVRNAEASRDLYVSKLGISFKEETDGYLHTEALAGTKSFALWPLPMAAQSCFGKDKWPARTPVPQAWIEFEVEDLAEATAALESAGLRMLTKNKLEPWGQRVSRFLSPEGILVAVSFTPCMREEK